MMEYVDDDLDLMADENGSGLEGDGTSGMLYEHFRMEVDKGQDSVRIDKYL